MVVAAAAAVVEVAVVVAAVEVAPAAAIAAVEVTAAAAAARLTSGLGARQLAGDHPGEVGRDHKRRARLTHEPKHGNATALKRRYVGR